jgi:hypothetical protein
MKKCPDCGAREVKGSILHRKGCAADQRYVEFASGLRVHPNAARGDPSDPRPLAESPTVREMGRLGGQARARNLSKERMSEIGRLAAQKRWEKAKEGKE